MVERAVPCGQTAGFTLDVDTHNRGSQGESLQLSGLQYSPLCRAASQIWAGH